MSLAELIQLRASEEREAGVDWGHVGDINDVVESLEEIESAMEIF